MNTYITERETITATEFAPDEHISGLLDEAELAELCPGLVINGGSLRNINAELLDCWEDLRESVHSSDTVEFLAYVLEDFPNADLYRLIELSRWKDALTVVNWASALMGESYVALTIRGYTQSDWATLYLPERQKEMVTVVEDQYFERGTQWFICIEGQTHCLYVPAYEDVATLVRSEAGVSETTRVVLKHFDHYQQEPVYRIEVVA